MFDDLTQKVIGTAIEVHKELGSGFLEKTYEDAMCFEFNLRGIFFEKQKPIDIFYKGVAITKQKIDLIVENKFAEGPVIFFTLILWPTATK